MSDIPAELGKQIGVLQRFAAAHEIQNTEHVQRVVEMRETIVTCLDGIHNTTKQVQDAVSQNQASLNALKADYQNPRPNTVELGPKMGNSTQELHSTLREQNDLLLALRSFLEDKVAAQERASQREKQHGNNHMPDAVPSWPRKTLTTAQLAMVLLSAIVPNVAAATLATREHQSRKLHREGLSKHMDFQHLHLTRLPPRVSAAQRAFAQNGGTDWVSEFARQRKVPPNEGTELASSRKEERARAKTWSGKLSKLRGWDGDGKRVGLENAKGGWSRSMGFAGERSASCRSEVGMWKSTQGEVGRENGRSSGDADASGGVEEYTRGGEKEKTTTTNESQKRIPDATKTSSSASSPGSRRTTHASKATTSPRDKVPNQDISLKRHEMGSRSAYYHGGSNGFACPSGAMPRCGSSD